MPEANALIDRGRSRFPGNPDLLILSARAQRRAGDTDTAVALWRDAIAVAPERLEPYVGLASTLRLVGKIDAAMATLAEAPPRFAAAEALQAETARCAEWRGAFEAALTIWDDLCASPTHRDHAQLQAARMLVRLRRIDEAEAVLASIKDPAGPTFEVIRGQLLIAREDWPAAAEYWRDFRLRHPDLPVGHQEFGRALEGLAFSRIMARGQSGLAAPLAEDRADIEVTEDAAVKRLLLGFESIGQSCEFGLVQRRFGAEPLGLLRWNTVDLDRLVLGLSVGLEGLGGSDLTELVTASNGEYFVRDRRWGLDMHTWLFVGQADPDTLFETMAKRLEFLAGKFRDDLVSGRKTFVYSAPQLDPASVETLHDALRLTGPAHLLAVQTEGGSATAMTPGEVIQLGPARYLGRISRTGHRPDGVWDIVFDEWIAICRRVQEMRGLDRSE